MNRSHTEVLRPVPRAGRTFRPRGFFAVLAFQTLLCALSTGLTGCGLFSQFSRNQNYGPALPVNASLDDIVRRVNGNVAKVVRELNTHLDEHRDEKAEMRGMKKLGGMGTGAIMFLVALGNSAIIWKLWGG